MKKYIIIVLVFLVSFSGTAQLEKEKGYVKQISEKLKALKIAHITEQLDLTTKEAEVFWPIYNAHEEKLNTLRTSSSEQRRKFDLENATEEQAKKHVLDMLKIEKEKQNTENKFISDLLNVLPATKVIKLNRAERAFKRKMIEHFKNKRGVSIKED
ncbi:MAG: sensor of ECF-type sigma factor [Olleya sp.]